MTPGAHNLVLTTEAFAALGSPDLVYVRPIKAAEILADAPDGATDFRPLPLKPGTAFLRRRRPGR